MVWAAICLVTVVTVLTFTICVRLFIELARERKRNRITQAFVAGVIRAVSDYRTTKEADLNEEPIISGGDLPIEYAKVLACVKHEFSEDFWAEPFKEWLANDRLLFHDPTYTNGGFASMYLDMCDSALSDRGSPQYLSAKEKAYLHAGVMVTEENATELRGEIGIYRDLVAGMLSPPNDLASLLHFFDHIQPILVDQLMEKLIAARATAEVRPPK